MTELMARHNYAIANATTDDVVGIGVVHFESTRAAYPNEEIGITEEWIDATWSNLKEPEGDNYRKELVRLAEEDPEHNLYLASKDTDGKVVGFIHATKTAEAAKLEGLYLLEEAHGTGLADDLIERVIQFAGKLPTVLNVADYNDRAIAFYNRYGFQIVPNKRGIIKEKLPVVEMLRLPEEEDGHEI